MPLLRYRTTNLGATSRTVCPKLPTSGPSHVLQSTPPSHSRKRVAALPTRPADLDAFFVVSPQFHVRRSRARGKFFARYILKAVAPELPLSVSTTVTHLDLGTLMPLGTGKSLRFVPSSCRGVCAAWHSDSLPARIGKRLPVQHFQRPLIQKSASKEMLNQICARASSTYRKNFPGN